MNEHKAVLVLGGTGHYGRHIVRSLLKRGQLVRVLSRSAEKARRILGEGVEIVEGDITARAALVKALHGARAVIISVSAMSPQLIRRLEAIERDAVLAVLAEAEAAGVQRVVYISVYDIRQSLADELRLESARIKQHVERELAGSRLNWTVLGAAPSMELFFAMIRGDTMVVPGGGPPALPTLSPLDLGEIAAQAALRDDLGGRRFRIAGPEALSFPQAAARISAATGRPFKFRKIPMLLPRIASLILGALAPLSDRLLFVHTMLGYINLLNAFPLDIAAEAAWDHQVLRDTFDYTPTTLEMEAQRREDVRVTTR
ncbi:MAG: NAD(P)H-binding protein [Thermoflexales bacterium]|nr:NAD(P)H-binding protein [Thermoflexales bacterium]